MVSNNKWYVLLDVKTNKVVDYMQLPEIWLDLPDMWSLSDDQLANIYKWSDYKNYSFISLSAAREMHLNVDNLNYYLNLAKPRIMLQLRAMRDLLLTGTDIATVGDRWASYDTISQSKITKYRTALRDITDGDITNVVWPVIPSELDFIRTVDLSSIDRPWPDFMACLIARPMPSIATIREEQAERIFNEREQRKAGGVEVKINGVGYWFWTDDTSRAQYSLLDGVARRNNLPGTFVMSDWKTMSGDFVKMSVDLLNTVIDAGVQQEMKIFKVAEVHRLTMLASSDPASYNYLTGWPMSYKDYLQSKKNLK